MAAIGNVMSADSVTVNQGCKWGTAIVVALAVIATLTIALSAWSNARVATVYGGEGILRFSPYTLLLPAGIVTVCAFVATVFLMAPAVQMRQGVHPSVVVESQPAVAVSQPVVAVPQPVVATMMGQCVSLLVQEGEWVEVGAPLYRIEVMKMELEIRADRAGRVLQIHTTAGTILNKGDPVVTLVPI